MKIIPNPNININFISFHSLYFFTLQIQVCTYVYTHKLDMHYTQVCITDHMEYFMTIKYSSKI